MLLVVALNSANSMCIAAEIMHESCAEVVDKVDFYYIERDSNGSVTPFQSIVRQSKRNPYGLPSDACVVEMSTLDPNRYNLPNLQLFANFCDQLVHLRAKF